jgi:hypothetical protein
VGDESFELDRPDFRAVLLALAAALVALVGVKRAFDAVDPAVEQVDQRPQQIGQVGFKPGVGERQGDRVKEFVTN